MDATSIADASEALVGSCANVSWYIHTFINKSQYVDTAMRVLAVEIDSLSQVVGSITLSFRDPSLSARVLDLQTGYESEFWNYVKRSMDDCKDALGNLERIFENIKENSSRIVLRPRRQTNLEMKSEEIASLKQQVNTYRQIMQLSSQLLTV